MKKHSCLDYAIFDAKLNCINTYKISTYALKLNVIELGNVFSL
jgi:hypothetical protein